MKTNQEIENRIKTLNYIYELWEKPLELKLKIPNKDYKIIENHGPEWFLVSGYSPSMIEILNSILNKTINQRVLAFNQAIEKYKLLSEYMKSNNSKAISKLSPYQVINVVYSYCWIFDISDWGQIPDTLEEFSL